MPEPVFAPQEGISASAASVAQNLIKALLTNQAQSSFWGRTPSPCSRAAPRLLGNVDVDGQTATVNLGGAAARVSPARFELMAAQLVVTLTSNSYAQPPVAGSVMLEVNGRVRPIDGRPVVGWHRFAHFVPTASHRLPLYFISNAGLISELRPGTLPQPVQKPLASGQQPVRPDRGVRRQPAPAGGHDDHLPTAASSTTAR